MNDTVCRVYHSTDLGGYQSAYCIPYFMGRRFLMLLLFFLLIWSRDFCVGVLGVFRDSVVLEAGQVVTSDVDTKA